MYTIWKLFFCVGLVGASCSWAADVESSLSSAPPPTTECGLVFPVRSSLNLLPPEIIHHIVLSLDIRSMVAFDKSCRYTHAVLSEPSGMVLKLKRSGFLITDEWGQVTESGAVILASSPTLVRLWSECEYSQIIDQRSLISSELKNVATQELDHSHIALLLTQAIVLGDKESVTLLKKFLFGQWPEKALSILMEIFLNEGFWVGRAEIDDLILDIVSSSVERKRDLFRDQCFCLKSLCKSGSFGILTMLSGDIDKGISGFIRNKRLSEMIRAFLSRGTLDSTWSIARHKKYRKYEKLTLQDVLSQIMSAIEMREDE